jgi:CRISPR system Cascade subunit CasC
MVVPRKLHIELHQFQNMLGCPNRDDTNQVKTAMLGNSIRGRWASQSIKYAMNHFLVTESLLSEDEMGERTRVISIPVCRSLINKGESQNDAANIADAICRLAISSKNSESGYLLYTAHMGIDKLMTVGLRYKKDLLELCNDYAKVQPLDEGQSRQEWSAKLKDGEKNKVGRIVEKFQKTSTGKNILKEVLDPLNGLFAMGNAISIAAGGRMVSDRPEFSIIGAMGASHAITTNKIRRDTDFLTAMDTIAKQAAMLEHQSFSSGCYYKYHVWDVQTMINNLHGQWELALYGIKAYIEAAIKALPVAKLNSFGNYNLPDFVMLTIRNKGCNQSFLNAFVKPVTGEDLLIESVLRLAKYYNNACRCYPDDGATNYYFCTQDKVLAEHKWNQDSEAWIDVRSIRDIVSQAGKSITEYVLQKG